MTVPQRLRRLPALAGAAAALLVIGACGQDASEPGDADSPDETEQPTERPEATEVSVLDPRLVLTHDGGIMTLDTASGEVIDEAEFDGFIRVNPAGDGRHVFVTTAEGFELYDSGLHAWLHGDHYHYYASEPFATGLVYPAEAAGHVVPHAGLTALFADGTGEVTLFDPAELGEIEEFPADPPVADTWTAPEAHHGVAVPLDDDELVVTVGNADERTGAALLGADREEISSTDQCPGVHGETVAQDHVVALGCEDGPVLLRDGEWHKVEVDEDYARTGNLFGTHTSPVILGDYNTDPDGGPMTEVALIDIRDESLQLVDVGAPYNFRSLARGPEGEALVLTEDGVLYVLDPETGEELRSVEAVAPWEEPEEWQEPRPAVHVSGEIVYVTEPATDQVHAVEIATGEVLRSYDLPHTPNEITSATGFPPDASEEDHEGHDHGDGHDHEGEHEHDHEHDH